MDHPVIFKPTLKKLVLYLGPAVLIYGFVVFTPLLGAIWHSLHTDFNFSLEFVGFENYIELIQDSNFWFAFRNNLIIIGLSIVFQIGLAFVIAILMNSRYIFASKFLRTVLFFPVVLSPVVVAFLWILIYDINNGLLNTLLRSIGLDSWTRLWLDDPSIVIISVTVPLIWQFVGLYLVVFLAGLSGISHEMLEAAEIDGANILQKTLFVTLPLLSNTWKVVFIMAISGGVKIFEHPFVMTGGGPGRSSTVIAQYAYEQSFGRLRMTYGSTIAVVMVILSFLLILITVTILDKVIFRTRGKNAT